MFDRTNLLLAALTLRDRLIEPEQLAEVWASDVARGLSLTEALARRGWLSDGDRSTLEDRVRGAESSATNAAMCDQTTAYSPHPGAPGDGTSAPTIDQPARPD